MIADPVRASRVTRSIERGATGTAPASTTLTATAAPYTGFTISSVQFYQNGTAVGPALTASPYSTSWTGIAQGSYSITAKATDSQSNRHDLGAGDLHRRQSATDGQHYRTGQRGDGAVEPEYQSGGQCHGIDRHGLERQVL